MSGRPELEYLRPPVRSDGPIFLADPDPAWVGQYALAERLIRAALERRAILIEHVGSTSVPELVAKPVIDADAKSSVVEEIISRAQADQRRDLLRLKESCHGGRSCAGQRRWPGK